MRFRPCIDIHNGRVKQIVGGSLSDQGNHASENFVADHGGEFFADFYRKKNLPGGHVILLNPAESEYYERTKQQALSALKAYPGGLQAGGGITPYNAEEFLKAGASHVIVTSYIFSDGCLHRNRLKELCGTVGKDHLVLDLSCRKKGESYYIVTDRWQKYTDVCLNEETVQELAEFCDEFLIHGVDVEGKSGGIEEDLTALLGKICMIPATYAGGVHNFRDLEMLKKLGHGKIDVTIGSALDLFGGNMSLDEVLNYIKN